MGQRRRGGFMFFNITSSGNMFVITFVSLVVISSLLLARGFFPKSTLTDPKDNTQYELDDQEQTDSATGLQLRTLKLKECKNAVAVDMLLDRSASMQEQNKMTKLKEAANGFTSNLSDNSLIGIQSFSSTGISNDVPISLYASVKPLVGSAINGLRPSGATPTKDALEFTQKILADAVQKYPGKNFVLIFVSDGAPCPGIGCPEAPGANQDPALYTPNPASEIKSLGVTIYTIAIGSDPLNSVMSGIASSPDTMFSAPTGAELKGIYDKIATRLCNKVN